MAEKRMFAKSIVLTDAFLDMPMSARCLYFTLGMLADDDGFVGSPKSIMRQCGASQDDLAVLLSKRFVLGFDSGVLVIKHWRINNYLQASRHHPTNYQEELATLMMDEKGAYTEANKNLCLTYDEQLLNNCIQDVDIDKNSIEENSIDKSSKEEKRGRFAPPSVEEVRSYCQERNNSIDPEAFVDFYSAKGWKVGNNPMKDWKAAVRTWERREATQPSKPAPISKNASPACKPIPAQDPKRLWAKVNQI